MGAQGAPLALLCLCSLSALRRVGGNARALPAPGRELSPLHPACDGVCEGGLPCMILFAETLKIYAKFLHQEE